MPKMSVEDWRNAIRDTLIETYVKQRGTTPVGVFEPKDELVEKILEAFKGKPESAILRFCRKSMYAHMLKTQQTHTPFFIKNILSDASLDYLAKHDKYLIEFYENRVEPLNFFRSVYGEFLACETDYLDVIGNLYIKGKEKIDWDLIEPGVHWIIFAQMFRRFDDEVVGRWDEAMVEVNHEYVPMRAARPLERKNLGDALRFEESERAFTTAVRDAAIAWVASLGLLHTRINEAKEVVLMPTAEDVPIELLEPTKPLLERDIVLFEWVRGALLARAQDPEAGRAGDIASNVTEFHEREEEPLISKMEPEHAAKRFADNDDR